MWLWPRKINLILFEQTANVSNEIKKMIYDQILIKWFSYASKVENLTNVIMSNVLVKKKFFELLYTSYACDISGKIVWIWIKLDEIDKYNNCIGNSNLLNDKTHSIMIENKHS